MDPYRGIIKTNLRSLSSNPGSDFKTKDVDLITHPRAVQGYGCQSEAQAHGQAQDQAQATSQRPFSTLKIFRLQSDLFGQIITTAAKCFTMSIHKPGFGDTHLSFKISICLYIYIPNRSL